MTAILLAGHLPAAAEAQVGNVPPSPDAWTATDSIRAVSYLGHPALYINRGVALVRAAKMENGTLELDMAASDTTNARTTVTAARDEIRRMQYAYSDGVVVYLNGGPLAFAMNPSGLRGGLGVMTKAGDGVYLPLKRGRNQLVLAVVECTGGWAFSARLDPPEGAQ
jgi:hypothetical protein